LCCGFYILNNTLRLNGVKNRLLQWCKYFDHLNLYRWRDLYNDRIISIWIWNIISLDHLLFNILLFIHSDNIVLCDFFFFSIHSWSSLFKSTKLNIMSIIYPHWQWRKGHLICRSELIICQRYIKWYDLWYQHHFLFFLIDGMHDFKWVVELHFCSKSLRNSTIHLKSFISSMSSLFFFHSLLIQ
jgi:hypothetical protein